MLSRFSYSIESMENAMLINTNFIRRFLKMEAAGGIILTGSLKIDKSPLHTPDPFLVKTLKLSLTDLPSSVIV